MGAETLPRPLAGVRVLEFAETLPGPYCGRLLADLGASVVKVERVDAGDPLRQLMPNLFEVFNRGKRSIALDLKHPLAAEVAAVLFSTHDIVLESARPGVAARLGIGWDTARRVKPDLVYCSISGFGQHGPLSQLAGHDVTYAAAAGLLGPVSLAPEAPRMAPVPLGDMAAGALAGLSVVALLLEARQTGRGRYCDLSITDVLASWTASRASDFLQTGRLPDVSEQQPPTHGIYRAADGRYVALGAIEDHFWTRLCDVAGRSDWAARPELQTNLGRARAGAELGVALADLIATAPASSWVERLTAADIPASLVLGVAEAVESEQLRSRRIFEPDGARAGWSVGFPALVDDLPVSTGAPAPTLGTDTASVLLGAGCEQAQVTAWAQQGLFGSTLVDSSPGDARGY